MQSSPDDFVFRAEYINSKGERERISESYTYDHIFQVMRGNWKFKTLDADGNVAEQQISDGALRGYLAYVDGISIGWCNVNDRANYPAEPYYDEVLFHAPVEM